MQHTMPEAAQPFGITVSVTVTDENDRLDSKVSSMWALFLHGIAVAVADGQAQYKTQTEGKAKVIAAGWWVYLNAVLAIQRQL